MGSLYHSPARRAGFVLDGARTVGRRLRPFSTVVLWVVAVAVPWAVLSLLVWAMLRLFAMTG
jgi:hypothetical protein